MGRIVHETSLVDYYASYKSTLAAEGFKILLLALIRDADIPTFYDDITRYWDSLDDLTGPYVVFAVAGSNVAADLNVDTLVFRGGGTVNFNMASLSGRRRYRYNKEAIQSIRQHHTSQVGALAASLRLSEADLPCLHLTYLSEAETTSETAIVSLRGAAGFSIYTACKDIMEYFSEPLAGLQHSENHWSESSRIESHEHARLRSEVKEAEKTAHAAREKLQALRKSMPNSYGSDPSPDDVEVEKIVDDLRVAIVRCQLEAEVAEALDVFVEALAYKQTLPPRTKHHKQQYGLIRRYPEFSSKIERLAELAHRGACLPEIRHILIRQIRAEQESLFKKIRAAEDGAYRAQYETWRKSQRKRDADRDLLERFRGFAASKPATKTLDSHPWDYFVSYPSADRGHAFEVFRVLERLGRSFIDFVCLAPGKSWRSRIQEVQSRSATTVAVITQDSKDERKAWYQVSELERAIAMARSGAHKIIPIYLDKSGPWFGLEQVHSIFASDGNDAGEKLRAFLEPLRPQSGRELPQGSN